jgi:hypothetical protein
MVDWVCSKNLVTKINHLGLFFQVLGLEHGLWECDCTITTVELLKHQKKPGERKAVALDGTRLLKS